MTLMVTPPERPSLSPIPLGKVRMRSSVAEDSGFLLELYASASQDELDTIGWNLASQRTFVIMQAQTREWDLLRRHPHLDRLTICVDDVPVGRMLVDISETVVHLVDVCLLPAWRGRGIGTRLVQDMLEEAVIAQLPVKVRVPKDSRVAAACERVNFTDPLDCGTEWLLTWTPPDTDSFETVQPGARRGNRIAPPSPVYDTLSY